jgi:hypothetical protein
MLHEKLVYINFRDGKSELRLRRLVDLKDLSGLTRSNQIQAKLRHKRPGEPDNLRLNSSSADLLFVAARTAADTI